MRLSGEVNLHALTRDDLDVAVRYAKAIGLAPLCITATKGSVGVCASDDLRLIDVVQQFERDIPTGQFL